MASKFRPLRGREHASVVPNLCDFGFTRLPAERAFALIIHQDLLRHVVDYHGTVEVGDGGISAVLVSHERAPRFRIHCFRLRARVPKIDATGCFAVCRQHIAFAKKAGNTLIGRRRAQENASRLFPCNRCWQLKRGDDGNHCYLLWCFVTDDAKLVIEPQSTSDFSAFLVACPILNNLENVISTGIYAWLPFLYCMAIRRLPMLQSMRHAYALEFLRTAIFFDCILLKKMIATSSDTRAAHG